MFASDRIFEQTNPDTGVPEWFFILREGIKGPHGSREQAVYELNVFTIAAKKLNLTGGRPRKTPLHEALPERVYEMRPTPPQGQPIFPANRVFQQTNPATGATEWFYSAREGIKGPYDSKERTLHELNLFKNISSKLNLTGGRESQQPQPIQDTQRTWHWFSPDRMFQQWNPATGLNEWFFIAREGVKGPHPSKDKALRELESFKTMAKRLGITAREARITYPVR